MFCVCSQEKQELELADNVQHPLLPTGPNRLLGKEGLSRGLLLSAAHKTQKG